MKNKIFQISVILGLILVFSFGFVLVAQAQWNPPTGGASEATNTSGPLNVGSSAQSKAGSLAIGKTTAPINNSILDVNGVALTKGMLVEGSTYVHGNTHLRSFTLIGPSSGANYGEGQIKASNDNLFNKLARFLGVFKTETVLADQVINPGGSEKLCLDPNASNYNQPIPCLYPNPPVNQPACGSASGGFFENTPPSNLLCSSGTSSGVQGSGADMGYWKWNCVSGTSAPAVCSANLGVPKILHVRGNTLMEGKLDTTGRITSGGKNVCLEDGTDCPAVVSQPNTNRFGGTYAMLGTVCENKNPITSACSCPPTFMDYEMAKIPQFSTSDSSIGVNKYSIKGNPPSLPINSNDLSLIPDGWTVTSKATLTLYGCYK